ncbi:hypothetical protein CCL42_gp07 [Sulfolobus islandicus rod-shaped virus 8]|uniref:Uncharacterized protein n=2 Tax=Usarudivirus TaxID=2843109 RepID=A0A1X9SJD4_9VIRU|nr:hypothetical protein CCL41_gp05 [Sulfolobus islandicus rod-shaped virus 9]YP_009362680.1 hypothetical protein CCL42_gp07 [Sulfolobus islandicus rod-shaped virus 8]ARQ96353.1 hypothetical protein [Sulfolobus islandicus rod-shaped virus 9]ARQ96413.1 hypothetical protein [Sulfolobus islandicus rod-shaped virus 8]
MNIVLREFDKEKFNINITAWLDIDNDIQSCYTNFKEITIVTIIQMISEIVEKDGWDLQYFEKDEEEKLFNAFMKNSKITVRLNKKIDELNYVFEETIVEFDFPEIEKKRIAEIYLSNILNNLYYFDECIIYNLDEGDINLIPEVLSDEVYQLLSPDEIKGKFKEKIEKIISDKE